MIKYLKAIFGLKSTLILLALSLFSVALSILRVNFTGHGLFLSMIWNLFLAFIPWFLMALVHAFNIRNRLVLGLIMVIWMVFFPNAPYVLTDLIHLDLDRSAPIWYDLIMLLSYGFAGLMYGFASLYLIEARLRQKWSPVVVNLLALGMIYLSCFGVYLGRFLRWNSWDLLTNLDEIFRDIYHEVNPFRDPTAWIFTLLFGTLLGLVYFGYKYLHVTTPARPATPPEV